jgi:tetratricopeptide (TPR) repeat protein
MKSNTEREPTASPITVAWALSLLAVVLLDISFPRAASPAGTFASLSEMARREAEDHLDTAGTTSLIRGYLAYGFGMEAASSLERRIRLGEFPRDAAAPLFDEIIADRRRWEDPVHVAAICEKAARNGIESHLLSYAHGTVLRMTGRLADATKVLARIGPDNPYRLHALFALGQISVERGDYENGRDIFKNVAEKGKDPPGNPLATRAVRAEAELLILMGRTAEASRLLDRLPRGTPDFMERVGAALVAEDPSTALDNLPMELIAGQPVRRKAQFLLLKGGLARDQGRFASAVADLTRADMELGEALSSEPSLAFEFSHRHGMGHAGGLLIEAQRSSREGLAFPLPREADAAVRAHAVELLVDLLFLDHYVSQASATGSPAGMPTGESAGTSGDVESILKRIERVLLEGIEQTKTALKWDSVFWDVDRFVSGLEDRTAVLPSLGHTVQRDRLLIRLERGQAEIRRLREKIIRQRRETAVAGEAESGDRTAIPAFLREFGLYLKELDRTRTALGDAREFTRTNARVMQQRKKLEGSSRKAMEDVARDTLAFANARMTVLLPSLRTIQDRARAAFLERERRDLAALRPLIRRHLADVLVAQARSLLRNPRVEAQPEFWTAVEKVGTLLAGGDLARSDRFDTAINLGSLLAGGLGRKEPWTGGSSGERGKNLISSLLPVLEAAGQTQSRREESLYLIAVLKLLSRDEGARSAALSFLGKFPGSPLSAGLAVRLGHEMLLAGDVSRAEALYRAASDPENPAVSIVARHMRGWIRYQSGDFAGALEELGHVLSEPSFACGDPGAFEKDVLSLSVRALRGAPPEDLGSYPPIGAGTCGGRRVLALLGDSEAGRGDANRAIEAYDTLVRRFPNSEATLSYEMKAIEELVRGGGDREAMSRALSLSEKYGAGSAWGGTQTPSVREKAISDLAGLLKNLSDRMFAEGIRSGDRSAMSLAAAGIERYFAVKGNEPGGSDGETHLKWAIASLRAGEREVAVNLLLELLGENRNDEIGERAAILYAETMIAGYERKEQTAEDAEAAAYLLVRDYPSDKAAALAFRAASDFLGMEDHERAAGIAEEIEKCKSAPKGIRAQARLIQAESSYFRGEPDAARDKAGTILEHQGADASPELLLRAKELYLLAALKEIEGKMDAKDWHGAGELLEHVAGRFMDRPEAPLYLLGALRTYRQAGREDAASRVGLLFLGEYPDREETLEVVGVVGPNLQARKEFQRAADLYEKVAEAFPGNSMAPRFLFHAARLSEYLGHRDAAVKRFSTYRSRYHEPRWMSAYATLVIGATNLQDGKTKTAIREMEAGLRQIDAGLEPDAPGELMEMAGKARISIGENWADQFRKASLVLPLEKSLAVKERFFRQALAAFEMAGIDAPLEVALDASRLSANLFVEFGKSILESQRPKGMDGRESAIYDEALKSRARTLFEKAFDRYLNAFDRLESEKGPPDLAVPFRDRLEEVQALLSMVSAPAEEKFP